MVYFLALSLLSGALELGSLFYALEVQAPVPLLFPLVYQLGNLLFLPALVTPRRARGLCILGLALALPGAPGLFLPALLAASLCVQAARAEQRSACPAWLKRTFRIGGFLFSPLTAMLPGPVMACCLLTALAALARGRGAPAPEETTLLPVMVFHQMHYFVYAYIMPAWVLSRTGSPLAAAAAFAVTWIVYLVPQAAAERANHISCRAMFFACHSFLFLVMAAMCIAAALDRAPMLMALWVLTGLGGGSVFCIQELTPACRNTDLTFSENVGHVLGCLTAVLLSCTVPGRLMIPVLTGSSCAFVGLALLSARKTVRREAC